MYFSLKYIQGAMGRLLTKLHKNEKNTDISLYEIYLPKFHINVLKYYRLKLFKKIAISFKYGLQTTSESTTSLSDGLFVSIGKFYFYSCLQFIFCVAQIFFGLTYFFFCFSRTTIGSPTFAAWYRFLLPDLGSSSSYVPDPGQHCLLHLLDLDHHVESEAM